MAVVHEIITLVVCQKIHGGGCVADNPPHGKSKKQPYTVIPTQLGSDFGALGHL
jgi:hypothetical protein